MVLSKLSEGSLNLSMASLALAGLDFLSHYFCLLAKNLDSIPKAGHQGLLPLFRHFLLLRLTTKVQLAKH